MRLRVRSYYFIALSALIFLFNLFIARSPLLKYFSLPKTTIFIVLFNINFLLFLAIIYLIGKNILRLFVEGGRLKTKMLLSFFTVSIVPSVIMFVVSAIFLLKSLDYWFPVEGEKTLKGALTIAQNYHNFMVNLAKKRLERLKGKLQRMDLSTLKRDTLDLWREDGGLDALYIINRKLKIFGYAIEKGLEKKVKLPETIRDKKLEIVLVKDAEWIWGIEKLKNGLYLLAGIYIPQNLTRWIENISESYLSYSQIKKLSRPLKGMYLLSLLIMSLLVSLASVWLSYKLSRSILEPIEALTHYVGKVGEGNLDIDIEITPKSGELGKLVDTFRWMVGELKKGRERMEKDKNFIESIVENIPAGIFALDSNMKLIMVNRYMEKLLGRGLKKYVGSYVFDILPEIYKDKGRELIKRVEKGVSPVKDKIDVRLDGKELHLMITLTPLIGEAEEVWAIIGVVEDLTEAVRMQRLLAWREAAKRIAHEIKNPLTPIKVSAERLRRKYLKLFPEETVLDDATRVILREVENIKVLVKDFSEMARFPAIRKDKGDIVEILKRIIKDCSGIYQDVEFALQGDEKVEIGFDRDQMTRVFLNIIKNAVEAMDGKDVKKITVSVEKKEDMVIIDFKDTGSGIRNDIKDKIFEPYFSTKEKGRGLGLTIVSAIVGEHGGRVYVKDTSSKGTTISVELPIDAG